jgi:hypothetical protein
VDEHADPFATDLQKREDVSVRCVLDGLPRDGYGLAGFVDVRLLGRQPEANGEGWVTNGASEPAAQRA